MVGSKFQGEQAPAFPLVSSALDAATTLIKYSSNMLDKYFNITLLMLYIILNLELLGHTKESYRD